MPRPNLPFGSTDAFKAVTGLQFTLREALAAHAYVIAKIDQGAFFMEHTDNVRASADDNLRRICGGKEA